MVRIALARDARGLFTGRDEYFDQHLGAADDREFCKVLGTSCGQPVPTPAVPGPAANDAWEGLPWLTLILGSGCLDVPDDPALAPSRFAQQVVERLKANASTDSERRKKDFEGEDPGVLIDEIELAREFTHALVGDRIQLSDAGRNGASRDDGMNVDVQPVAARLALVAALMNRFFFLAKAVTASPLGRWDQDSVTFLPKAHPDHGDHLPEIVDLIDWHCAVAMEELSVPSDPSREVREAIGTVIKDVTNELRGSSRWNARHHLEIGHVRLMTEIAWYLLTLHTRVYPGWTDLLFGLTLRDASRKSHIRPRFHNLRRQAELLPDLINPATVRSWENYTPDEAPYALYAAAADVLWSQAAAVTDPKRSKLPPASAFVASFDIELEMALWRSADKGKWFYVVIPVHVFNDANDPYAHPCWLRGKIVRPEATHGADLEQVRRASHLEQLRRPTEWELITPKHLGTSLLDGPHVVHIAGCPLMALPQGDDLRTIAASLGQVNVRGLDPARMVIEHAVTLDEYLAVRQSEAELLFSVGAGTDAQHTTDRALPSFLRSSSMEESTEGVNPRFWMALGVPMGDAAVRHRLISQITGRTRADVRARVPAGSDADPLDFDDVSSDPLDFGDPSDPLDFGEPDTAVADDEATGDQPLPDDGPFGEDGDVRMIYPPDPLKGVVVNRRISDDEAHLLYWAGFDVVAERASAFTSDLRHYAHHLRSGGRPMWPGVHQPCRLDEEGPRR